MVKKYHFHKKKYLIFTNQAYIILLQIMTKRMTFYILIHGILMGPEVMRFYGLLKKENIKKELFLMVVKNLKNL